jgi:hypothetical protein
MARLQQQLAQEAQHSLQLAQGSAAHELALARQQWDQVGRLLGLLAIGSASSGSCAAQGACGTAPPRHAPCS